ncbi:late competence development ComFB family protein [Sphaerospermopsis aphanizomenoides BCCUSP55]|uniref:late competence development ComFB family protein n=1 Tax=Sphaerospermopsis aphanizomenoides TaxID=459663 RepID=UPI000A95DE01|nr:late competence development ComFB family protein [Sphaerospermopsis aphanizomenoides]MBK1986857.1 late competence development ComFB family protein [Sphaerospermopsis aphanizomenoides BCCUSP55]
MSSYRPSLNSSHQYPKQNAFTKHSRNVMEMLVVEEVEKQIQSLPVKIANYIQSSEVVAYALNRLPCLYATSKRGWQRQWHHGKTELYQKITMAVRQGIVAVQRDPLRVNDPLNFQEDQKATEALDKLKVILQREDLSWDNLSDVVQQTLVNTSKGRITWRRYNCSDNDTFDWEKHRL